ncbi:MAG: hypothetical protein R3A79_19940 [Nannocystaceae bacterium]
MRAALLALLPLAPLACTPSAAPESPTPTHNPTPPAPTREPTARDEGDPPPAEGAAPRPRALDSLAAIEAALGREITIVGAAVDAKLSAAVLVDGAPIYCLGQERWSEGVAGELVEVTGAVRRTDRFRAEVAGDGAIAQGTAGGDLVIEPCRYHLLTID